MARLQYSRPRASCDKFVCEFPSDISDTVGFCEYGYAFTSCTRLSCNFERIGLSGHSLTDTEKISSENRAFSAGFLRKSHRARLATFSRAGWMSHDLCSIFLRCVHRKANVCCTIIPRPLCDVHMGIDTVLVLIKLTKFAVALRLRCGSCKLIFLTLVNNFR